MTNRSNRRAAHSKKTKAQLVDELTALEEALHALDDGFVLFDAEDRIVLHNTKHQAMFPSVAEYLAPGVTYRELLTAQAASGQIDAAIGREEEWVEERVQRHINPGEPFVQKFADGRVFRLSEHKTPSGGIVAIRSDITDLHNAQADLLHQNEFFQILIDAIPAPVFYKDRQGIMLGCNTAFQEYIGRDRSDILGATAYDIADRDLADIYTQADEELFSRGGKQVYETQVTYTDGTRRDVVFHKAMFGPDEAPEGVIGVLLDISDRKRAEEASQQFLSAIEAFSGGFVYFDADDRLVVCNEEYRTLHGTAVCEVVPGIKFEDLLRAEVEGGAIAAAIGREEEWIGERLAYFRNPTGPFEVKRGENFWVQVSEERLPDGGLLGVGIDITERKRAEEALRESERGYHALFDNAQVGLAWTDLHTGRIIEANKQWVEMFGYADKEALIEGFRAANHYADPTDRDRGVARLKSDGFLRNFETRLKRLDGSVDWVRFDAVYDRTNEIIQSVLTDISEHKQLEQDVIKAKDEAELANRAKSEFLANMSHELRTPLNAIMGFSQLMKNQTFGPIGDERYKTYAQDVYESGEHLLSLINDILDLSKIEAGSAEVRETEIDVSETVDKCLTLVKDRTEEAGLSLVTKGAPDFPLLRLDERMLKQMLINLLTNAIKFTADGGSVTISWERSDDGRLRIAVSDTGIGIAAEDLPKALEVFGQIEGSFERQYEGTGLGLPLVQSLAALHGGGIEIDSAVGAGTTVTIWFPPERVVPAKR